MELDDYSKQKAIDYWLRTAKHDYRTMQVLYVNKRYSDALFFGHIILEKVLKALYVKINSEHAPYTHDLVLLVEQIDIPGLSEHIIVLNEINHFNIRARYPEDKFDFYKKASQEFTRKYKKEICFLYRKIWRIVKS